MKIYLGSDHAGVNLKKVIKGYLEDKFKGQEEYSSLDLGVFTNDATDYPDIAREVCEKVLENEGALGILICGSGVGMSISANRMQGIRAVLADNELTAKMSRSHNDTNVLCMGERFVGVDLAKSIVDAFLATEFEADERHVRRIEKMDTVMKRIGKAVGQGSC